MKHKHVYSLAKGIVGIVSKVDYSRMLKVASRAGIEIGKSLKKACASDIARKAVFVVPIFALGALSRQSEVNKLKAENERLSITNDLLREKVKNLNDSVVKVWQETNALKAYHFVQRGRFEEEKEGCIAYQYATKEFIEIMTKESIGTTIDPAERDFMVSFGRVLNDGYDIMDAKLLKDYVMSKYKNEIDKEVEYDCLPLIEKMGQKDIDVCSD